MAADQIPHVPCFLCNTPLDVRYTFKEKPYLVCDSCGLQIFIRGRDGVKRFQKVVDASILRSRGGRG